MAMTMNDGHAHEDVVVEHIFIHPPPDRPAATMSATAAIDATTREMPSPMRNALADATRVAYYRGRAAAQRRRGHIIGRALAHEPPVFDADCRDELACALAAFALMRAACAA